MFPLIGIMIIVSRNLFKIQKRTPLSFLIFCTNFSHYNKLCFQFSEYKKSYCSFYVITEKPTNIHLSFSVSLRCIFFLQSTVKRACYFSISCRVNFNKRKIAIIFHVPRAHFKDQDTSTPFLTFGRVTLFYITDKCVSLQAFAILPQVLS